MTPVAYPEVGLVDLTLSAPSCFIVHRSAQNTHKYMWCLGTIGIGAGTTLEIRLVACWACEFCVATLVFLIELFTCNSVPICGCWPVSYWPVQRVQQVPLTNSLLIISTLHDTGVQREAWASWMCNVGSTKWASVMSMCAICVSFICFCLWYMCVCKTDERYPCTIFT